MAAGLAAIHEGADAGGTGEGGAGSGDGREEEAAREVEERGRS